MSSGGWKKKCSCQLQVCNTIHVLSGALSIGLAATQFTPISLENYNYIDFRLVNWVHILTGCIGIFMILKNYGSIAAKTLYIVSTVLGLFTAGFYAKTLNQAIKRHKDIESLTKLAGAENDGYLVDKQYHSGKISICVLMIGIGAIEFFNGLLSIKYLTKLASDSETTLRKEFADRTRLAFVAGMKLFFSVATVVLGCYMEHLYDKQTNYIKIGWQILAGGIVAASGFVDLMAVNWNKHSLLNLKVSLVMSISAAVISLKTVDYMMSGFFLSDVSEYTSFEESNKNSELTLGILDSATDSKASELAGETKRQLFIKFTVHASVIGCLVLLFIHCIISAVEAGSFMERCSVYSQMELTAGSTGLTQLPPSGSYYLCNRYLFGVLQFACGLSLIVLCIISLIPWEFAEGYINGPGVLWVGCLFIAAGSVNSHRIKTLSTSVYCLGVISSVVAAEYFCFTLNSLYQAATNPGFDKEPKTKHTGRLVLYGAQALVLFIAFGVASAISLRFGGRIQSIPGNGNGYSQKSFLSFFHFLYAVVTIGISILSEIAIWKYSATLTLNSYVKQTNGPIVFVCGIVQVFAAYKPEFLLPSAILQIVCAGISFFVIGPAVSSLYYLFTMYQIRNDPLIFTPQTDNDQKLFQEVAIGLTSVVIVLAMIEYIVSIVSALNISYLMHHYFGGVKSDGGRLSTMRSQLVPAYYSENSQITSNGTVMTNSNGINHMTNGNLHTMNGAVQLVPAVPQRFFGSEYRTYAENRMYNPDDIIFKSGNSAQYGYVQQNRLNNSYAQTNVRHVFQNGYLNAYT